MSDKDMFDFLKAPPAAAPAKASAPVQPEPAPAASEQPGVKLQLPKQVRDLLLSPPVGCDAMAQLKAFEMQYEIGYDLITDILDTASPSYSAEQLDTLAARLPKPEPVVEPDPQPLADAPAPAEKPAKRGRRATANPKDGDPLTRAERLALACAMLGSADGPTSAEAAAFVIGGEG
jgi:hypothetical protein